MRNYVKFSIRPLFSHASSHISRNNAAQFHPNQIVVKRVVLFRCTCFVSQQQFRNNSSSSSTNYNCLSSPLTGILPFGRLNVVLGLYKYGGILKWDSLWCHFLFIRPSAAQMKLAERMELKCASTSLRVIIDKWRPECNEYEIGTTVADFQKLHF